MIIWSNASHIGERTKEEEVCVYTHCGGGMPPPYVWTGGHIMYRIRSLFFLLCLSGFSPVWFLLSLC